MRRWIAHLSPGSRKQIYFSTGRNIFHLNCLCKLGKGIKANKYLLVVILSFGQWLEVVILRLYF